SSESTSLELESSFACRLCQRLHASVVQVAGAVEDDRFDVRLLRVLGQQLADLGRLFRLVALERLLQIQPARSRQRLALDIVDELRLDSLVRAEDDEPRPLGRAVELAADAPVAARAGLGLGQNGHQAGL